MKEKRGPNGQKIKLQILGIIRDTIRKSQWSQMTAAKIIGVDQPKVSQIINGKTTGFSLERLLIFLLRLRCTVELSVKIDSQSNDKEASIPIVDDLDAINFVVVSKDS
ncbi:XRE family transcriptional regulator [Candidatus Anaplasma sp. TIGMIC]|uniref:XRE family transcriptional regulator n=1 Tax=Candidatus Anaplasma sp. TIGMIC TaxID=3020713 RepID=UPI00232D0879|nr:XRE family transcriptional regulator [Candidatus Anaplasma sp. TIGMIC]MDB1135773.1 XRE family transcriptional regulator [Candidatus Anaplasma sp. TIGMIC]